uniref:histidine kinase n=1 Tax=Roseihalotalea indica TaxID=2867963 RepID=A0AA49GML2_9BACT|nr:HAMP domain-containing sensor histidine kinase [Tunicatimonas sp. TK19036]
MSIDQPEFSKSAVLIHRDCDSNNAAQEYNSQYLSSHLLSGAEIHWNVGDSKAIAQFQVDKEPRKITLPLQQVYGVFQHQEDQFRKLILLLEKDDAQLLEAVLYQKSSGGETLPLRVRARINRQAKNKGVISLTFAPEGELSKGVVYPICLDEIPLALLYVESQTGAIIEANATALELLAMPDDDLTNIRWQRSPEWLTFIQEVNDNGQLWNRVLEVSPGKAWALFSARRIAGQVIVFAQNISSFQEQIQTLQKVNVGLDNFVYHASHDLRAPLRSMQGLITLLRTETNEKERGKFVELIEGSIKRLDAFLVDLLSISRSNRPERRPMVKINFMLEVEKAIGSFFHLGDNKNLEVSTRISQPVTFVSDLTQVRVILNNIISNAFKYRRYEVKKSRIKIEINVSRKRANIRISDNGEGIASEHLAHIFEMFYRATDRSEGSGLGLYIVRETVEKLKGTIKLKSEPNQGTEFIIMLPNQYQASR